MGSLQGFTVQIGPYQPADWGLWWVWMPALAAGTSLQVHGTSELVINNDDLQQNNNIGTLLGFEDDSPAAQHSQTILSPCNSNQRSSPGSTL